MINAYLRADGRKGIRNTVVVATWSNARITSRARSITRSANRVRT